MKQVRHNRIPSHDRIIRPIYGICGRCKKNKVTSHHFFCNKCHKDWDIEKKIIRIVRERKIDVRNIEKIKNILYTKYKIYKSQDIVGKYVSNLIQRRVLKGGEKNGTNIS